MDAIGAARSEMTTGPTERRACYHDECELVWLHLTPPVGQMRVTQVLGSPLKEQQRRIDGATFWPSGSPTKTRHGQATTGRPMFGNAAPIRPTLEVPASLRSPVFFSNLGCRGKRILDFPNGCKVSYHSRRRTPS